MLDKQYDAKKYEDGIYKMWEESGAFKADVNSEKEAFTISMPPPNATGTLHLGHAVMLALEDIMIRHRRMKGYEALYLPGTDHAAIATENVVIRKIKEEKKIKDPRTLGREAVIQEIKDFVANSQNTIRSQVRKMGTSCDWSRERYTMDEMLNRCVNEVFVKMYKDGLIYRGHRIVNWDPNLKTNVSDDEMDYVEKKDSFYWFKYGPFTIGTVRPETKFGDKYVVVHPDDERYQQYEHGETFECEWINGPITATIIKDKAADPEFGTGAMTITPWHSAVDFEIAERHNLDKEQIIDLEGNLLSVADEFAGMPITEAREKIVEKLDKKGLLVKVEENYVHKVAINSRGKGMIEPQIREQWFIDVNKKVVQWKGVTRSLKEVMQEVVRSEEIKILPERFDKIYFNWIDNLRDWCISRQIWWGHQIPVWYKTEGDSTDMHVGVQAPEGEGWERDPDTLDTWFSSGSWTWSTLIDPNLADDYSLSLEDMLENSPDFQKFHPTQVLETGYDILFFWVARMILMTTYTVGTIPFDTVYLHGLIRTREGKKMSKSDPKTCIDPLEVIEKYGADALRMSMVIGSSPGNDSRLYDEKIKGYRNFTNKLWNASRFVLGIFEENGIAEAPKLDLKNLSDADQWILDKLNKVVVETDNSLMEYKIGEAGQLLYDFVWNEFCDWYLELSKGEKQNLGVLYHCLKTILILLHPITPFVTEQIWSQLPGAEGMLIQADFPTPLEGQFDGSAVELTIGIVSAIRSMRAENQIEAAQKIPVTIFAYDHFETVDRNKPDIIRLARLSALSLYGTDEEKKLSGAAADVVNGMEIYIPLEGLVDTEKEKERLQKEIANLTKYIAGLTGKLSNKKFVQNAPEAIVEAEKNKLEEAEEKLGKMEEQLKNL